MSTIKGKIQKFKKKNFDRQHKDKGATDGDKHKYCLSLCRRPKKATLISARPRTRTYKDTHPLTTELYSEGSSP